LSVQCLTPTQVSVRSARTGPSKSGLRALLAAMEAGTLRSTRGKEHIQDSKKIVDVRAYVLSKLEGPQSVHVSAFGFLTNNIRATQPETVADFQADLDVRHGECIVQRRKYAKISIPCSSVVDPTNDSCIGVINFQAASVRPLVALSTNNEQFRNLLERETTGVGRELYCSYLCKNPGCINLNHIETNSGMSTILSRDRCPAYAIVKGVLHNFCRCSDLFCIAPGTQSRPDEFLDNLVVLLEKIK